MISKIVIVSLLVIFAVGLLLLIPKKQPLAAPGGSPVNDLVILACDGGNVDEGDTNTLSTIDITDGDCTTGKFCGECVAQLIAPPLNCKVQSYFSVGDLNTGVYELFCN